MIGGRSTATLRVAAHHADIWNMPGGSLADAMERSARLDQLCAAADRDADEITRSVFVRATCTRRTLTLDGLLATARRRLSSVDKG